MHANTTRNPFVRLAARAAARGVRPLVALAIVAATFALLPTTASAEPYMALREGYTCGDCHVNRTGGGMRSLTAEIHAEEILRLPNGGQGILPAHTDYFSPNINEYFSVGADFRLTEELTFQDDPDDEGRVKNNTAFRDFDRSDFDLAEGVLYAQIRLIPEYFSLYIDEQVAPGGASNREAFALLENVLPWGMYVKGGRFFPGWGLKLQDDEAFVNSASGFNFDRTLQGAEVGRSGPGWNWSASASDGGDDFNHLFMGSLSYVWSDVGPLTGLMVGGSAAHYKPEDIDTNSFTTFGGFSWGPLTLLAQGIYIDGEEEVEDAETEMTSTSSTDLWAIYTEANLLLFNWLNMKVAFDYEDPDDNEGDDERNRVSIGFEPFLGRFLQVRTFYRVYNGPENIVSQNRDELTIEAHVFF